MEKKKKYKIYGLLLYYILQILRKTLNIKIIKNENVDTTKENYIFAFWHNKLIGPTLCLNYLEKRAVLASPSKDGELIAVPLEKMGFHMVRGSSDKNSVSSVIALLKLLKKGYCIGTPVDGPKGPIYEVKQGLIYIAQKGGKKIIPMGVEYKNKWNFKNTWDKFELPKPFSEVICVYGEPIEILDNSDIDKMCEKLKDELIKVNKEAKKY